MSSAALPAVLRSTFLSLQRESPKLLLARQLLSSAATPAAWWDSQQCFASSAAVGSVLGWLLGLGDRHLDNLLLDTETGELLHIDFSVCFDKGAGLAVPEVVPFRMTQIMQVSMFAWMVGRAAQDGGVHSTRQRLVPYSILFKPPAISVAEAGCNAPHLDALCLG